MKAPHGRRTTKTCPTLPPPICSSMPGHACCARPPLAAASGSAPWTPPPAEPAWTSLFTTPWPTSRAALRRPTLPTLPTFPLACTSSADRAHNHPRPSFTSCNVPADAAFTSALLPVFAVTDSPVDDTRLDVQAVASSHKRVALREIGVNPRALFVVASILLLVGIATFAVVGAAEHG